MKKLTLLLVVVSCSSEVSVDSALNAQSAGNELVSYYDIGEVVTLEGDVFLNNDERWYLHLHHPISVSGGKPTNNVLLADDEFYHYQAETTILTGTINVDQAVELSGITGPGQPQPGCADAVRLPAPDASTATRFAVSCDGSTMWLGVTLAPGRVRSMFRGYIGSRAVEMLEGQERYSVMHTPTGFAFRSEPERTLHPLLDNVGADGVHTTWIYADQQVWVLHWGGDEGDEGHASRSVRLLDLGGQTPITQKAEVMEREGKVTCQLRDDEGDYRFSRVRKMALTLTCADGPTVHKTERFIADAYRGHDVVMPSGVICWNWYYAECEVEGERWPSELRPGWPF